MSLRKIFVFVFSFMIGIMLANPAAAMGQMPGSTAIAGVVPQLYALYMLDMTADSAGNIYVSGYGYNPTNHSDLFVVKYGPNGAFLWAKTYNGPASGADAANDIAVDSAGNVYVAGYSQGIGTSGDLLTIKYDANGNQQWVKRYNGPLNSWDSANAIAVDSAGNVFVAGSIYVGTSNIDFATIKYDSAGNQIWAKTYNGPASRSDSAGFISVDSAGNVYVAGGSDGTIGTSGDYTTLKYDANGNQLWVNRYNGPGNFLDAINGMAVDMAGNVYVTGISYGSPLGTTPGADFATIRYDKDGTEHWVRRYNGPGTTNDNYDGAQGLALDSAGNVYVSGWSRNQNGNSDFATIKYDSTGIERWVARYDSGYWDQLTGLVVDAAGNAYVLGTMSGYISGNYDYDYATVKYDTNGDQLWVNTYDNGDHTFDHSKRIALEGSGNVIVAGGNDISQDIVKYDPSGTQQLVIPILPDPEVMLANLIQYVSYVDSKNNAGLTAKLESAQSAYVKAKSQDYISAINIMDAFINACEADSLLYWEDRENLIYQAKRIIRVLQKLGKFY